MTLDTKAILSPDAQFLLEQAGVTLMTRTRVLLLKKERNYGQSSFPAFALAFLYKLISHEAPRAAGR